MAVEVPGFETVPGPVDKAAEGEKTILENGEPDQESAVAEPMNFGFHGDEPVKAEGNDVSVVNAPKNPSDDWPVPQVHSFYLPKVRQYDDPITRAKLDEASREISKKNQARIKITDALKAKRSERAEYISQLKVLRGDNRQYRSIMDEKIKEREPLQLALGRLRNSNSAGRGSLLCSSEGELNELIHALQYRIQHEIIPLNEEKQILREIKQLEGTRKDVIAYAAERAKLQDSFGPKEAIQDQVKLIGGDLDGVRKEKQAVQVKIKQLDDALKAIDKEIESLQEELAVVTQKREKTYKNIQQLRTERDNGNTLYYEHRKILMEARELAASKNVKALENLAEKEGNKFIELWSSDKAFRADYEKRILPSLDYRQLSRDGRIRNADEKPLVAPAVPTTSETYSSSKASAKPPKEELKTSPQDTLPSNKVQKEAKNKGMGSKSTAEVGDSGAAEISELDKPTKETPAVNHEIDDEKLKEMKREEEIAKAKQALERKKKLAEKAAAKAAIRAQKEAEKKLKDREKKAKKKAASSAPGTHSEEAVEASIEAIEEKVVGTVEASTQEKEKPQKENSVRLRSRAKGPESISKVILKRKKSSNYWIWAAPAAALLVLVIAFLIFNYGL